MTRICIFVILLILHTTFASKVEFLKGNKVAKASLSYCVAKASRKISGDTNTVTFVSSSSQDISVIRNTLQKLQNNRYKALMVLSVKQTFTNFHEYSLKNTYIVPVTNLEQLVKIIETLSSFSSWNSHSEFLVVMLTVTKTPAATALEFSEVLWKNDIIKVSVMLPDAERRSEYKIYSWNPFRKPKNLTNNSPIAYCAFGVIKKRKSWFPNMMESCYNNCTFKVNYIEWPPYVVNGELGFQKSNYIKTQGFDINLLNVIADKLNLTLSYSTSDIPWGKIHENGTMEGTLAVLKDKSLDILVGGYRKTADRAQHFDIMDSHIQRFEVWCVSNTPVVVGIRSMSNLLQKEVWFLAASVYFVISISVYLICNKKWYELSTYKEIYSILTTNLAVSLGVGGTKLPRSTIARYFKTLLAIFGFYLTLFYSSHLTSIISAPRYTQKYKSLKDIYDNRLNTYFMPDDIKWISEDADITRIIPLETIQERWKTCYNMSWCFHEIATSDSSSFYTDNLHKDYILSLRSYNMYCIQHNKVGIQLSIFLRKGFPLTDQFNGIFNRINEAGIILKWGRDLLTHKTPPDNGNYNSARIRLVNLIPIFKFLLIGNAVSSAVFLIEVLPKFIGYIFFYTNSIFI